MKLLFDNSKKWRVQSILRRKWNTQELTVNLPFQFSSSIFQYDLKGQCKVSGVHYALARELQEKASSSGLKGKKRNT